MRLALYSSGPKHRAPNLVALQDEALTALPTVLVCPLKAGIALTALRFEVPWGGEVLIACCDLARPIRRSVLRPMGWLDRERSQAIMERFLHLLAR
jgi:hypothetical protein